MVEDGTGEAHLYVYDDMVATVLKLSSQQWRHLLDLAMRTGELMYQRHKWFGGSSRPKVKSSEILYVFLLLMMGTVSCRLSRMFVVTLVCS